MLEPPDFDLLITVRQFLDQTRTASLATVDDAGRPHAANVQFARDEGDSLDLLWVSSPRSTHSSHIEKRQQVALTIYAHDDAAANIHGLQLHGTATAVPEHEGLVTCWEPYTQKYPVVLEMVQIREMLEQGTQLFYRFTPTWLRWIDNRVHFGWKVEEELR